MKSAYLTIVLFLIAFTTHGQGLDIPDPPVFESASFIPGSDPAQVNLTWLPSDSLDVEGYIIYKVNNGITQQYDTVWGKSTSSYLDNNSQADKGSVKYRMAAFDTLDNLSRLTDPHKTIFTGLSYDICALDITLNWSAYEGWSNIDQYKIYRKMPGSAYNEVGTVSGNKNSFTDNNPLPFTQYYYSVEAIRNDGVIAASNDTSVFTDSYKSPSFLNADYASVENGNIEIRFTVDTTGETEMYKILKSEGNSSLYQTIKTITNTDQTYILYTDTAVAPSEIEYHYFLQSFDPCGNVSKESNKAGNIILKVSSDEVLDHHLKWSEYDDWKGDVDQYKVYRHFGSDVPEYALTKGPVNRNAVDNISDYVRIKQNNNKIVPARYCYYVVAEEDNTNPHGIQGKAKSNEACVSHKARIYAPNAFYPNSYNLENREFKPVVSFIEEEGYKFVVYDRWGMIVFETTDPSAAWDGTVDSYRAKPGSYYYYITYKDASGEVFEKSGSFILFDN